MRHSHTGRIPVNTHSILVMKKQTARSLLVRKSRIHGRGVFAGENIEKGALLCVCPVLVVPRKDPSGEGMLGAYYYEWSRTNDALILGLISLVNHGQEPNTEVYTVHENKTAELYALKNLRKGEELLVDYGAEYPYIDPSTYRS